MSTFVQAKRVKFIFLPLGSVLILLSIAMAPASASPSLEVSPDSGLPSSNVAISGTGFDTLSKVTVTFGNEVVSTDPHTITTDALGKFEASFKVPQAAAPGINKVTATSQGILGSSSDSVSFSVLTIEDNTGKSRPSDPIAYYATESTDEDEEKLITLQGEGQDGESFTFSISTEPTHGVLSGLDPTSGSVSYKPENDYSGTDSFSFVVRSGNDVSDPATVTIHVNPVNDAPTIKSTHVAVEEDSQVIITLTAEDMDSSSVYFYLVDNPEHGQLGRLKLTGPFSAEIAYEPAQDYDGTDVLKIQVSDGQLYSDVSEVVIDVNSSNDVPVAAHAEITMEQLEPVSITLSASDNDGDTLSYTILSGPTHGRLSGNAPQLEYTPNGGYHGHDEFSFKATDGIADSNIAIVGIWVAGASSPNEPPAKEEKTTTPAPPTDNSGQEITDSQPPRILVPKTPVLAYVDSDQFGAAVNYSVSAQDDLDGEVASDCSPASGSRFSIGKVNVICVAKDKAGNTALDSFVVEIRPKGTETASSNENLVLPSLVAGGIVAAIGGIAVYGRSRHRSRSGAVITVKSWTWPGFNGIFSHGMRRISELWARSRGNH